MADEHYIWMKYFPDDARASHRDLESEYGFQVMKEGDIFASTNVIYRLCPIHCPYEMSDSNSENQGGNGQLSDQVGENSKQYFAGHPPANVSRL